MTGEQAEAILKGPVEEEQFAENDHHGVLTKHGWKKRDQQTTAGQILYNHNTKPGHQIAITEGTGAWSHHNSKGMNLKNGNTARTLDNHLKKYNSSAISFNEEPNNHVTDERAEEILKTKKYGYR